MCKAYEGWMLELCSRCQWRYMIIEILIRWTSSIVKWQKWEIFRIFPGNMAYTTQQKPTMTAKIHDFIIYENSAISYGSFPILCDSHMASVYHYALCAHYLCSYCSLLPSISFNVHCCMMYGVCIPFRVSGGCWVTHILINICELTVICCWTLLPSTGYQTILAHR